ncbi:MAG TPA: PAS domain-containing sensor histidine kinase, partial [Kiritimatiellia bacterium]
PERSWAKAWYFKRHPDDIPRIDANALKALKEGSPGYRQEFRCLDRFGEVYWIDEDVRVSRKGPDEWQLFGVSTDITGRKQQDAVVTQVVRHARCLFWHANVELRNDDLAWEIEDLNGPGEQWWIDDHEWKHLPEDRERQHANARKSILSGETSYSHEYRLRNDEGRVRWHFEDVHVEPVGPNRWHLVGVCTDITPQKLAEEKIREMENLRETFTQMLIHDLRSPLTGIAGSLELLRMNAETLNDADSTEVAAQGMSVVSSMTEMISSLLDVARFEEGKMPVRKARVDVRDVIRKAVDNLRGMAAMSDAPVECVLPDATVPVHCDPDLVGRIVGNLLGNAIRYLAGGKGIHVALEAQPGGARIAVIDSGPGIPEDFREKIFEKFGQVESGRPRQKYSSGLGLTFCKLAVEAHGGQIGVESEVGKGSTFWFTIPAAL